MSRGEIRSRPSISTALWSPWYTLHKTYAGLRDAYRYAGNRTALDVEVKVCRVGGGRPGADSSDEQMQRCSAPSSAA